MWYYGREEEYMQGFGEEKKPGGRPSLRWSIVN
jgi:hypothetical protein